MSDAQGNVVWTISAGELPSGLSLNASTGVVSGTPTDTVESASVTIMGTDENGLTATQAHTYDISLAPTISPASVTTTATVGEMLSTSAAVLAGFTEPFTWEINSGSLPSGLSLDPNTGVISGSPTASGTASFSLRLTDVNGLTATQSFVVTLEENCVPTFKIGNTTYTGTLNGTYSLPVAQMALVDFSDSCWSQIKVTLSGGGGGHLRGGSGGLVSGEINLADIPNQQFYSVIGGAGRTGTIGSVGNGGFYTEAGFNGGGRGVDNNSGSTRTTTGGGGGASDIRLNGGSVTNYSSANRILVAGGGGGGTSNGGSFGGDGGYPNGSAGLGYGGATGGTQTQGGDLGGSFGLGGENANNTGWNGGGGGGWYGGGAQRTQHGGGAGGSSYYNSSYISSFSHGLGSVKSTNGYGTIEIVG